MCLDLMNLTVMLCVPRTYFTGDSHLAAFVNYIYVNVPGPGEPDVDQIAVRCMPKTCCTKDSYPLYMNARNLKMI